ncbi:uncharacterized protein LOC116161422 [Photinus pyralis]|uniref:uncharacterized protein LOC116161422 n=1 Tax=Photinus pyralis TaxID=7054 RepID=UPI001267624E|nr:uncharacterized protein LOC116161422 [Photinus pyralis]
MGRHRSRSSSSSNDSDSTSSSTDGNESRSRGTKRRHKLYNEKRYVSPKPSTSREINTPSPPPSDKITRLENLVEKLIRSRSETKVYNRQFLGKSKCIPEFAPGNPNLSINKWIHKIEQLSAINMWDDATTVYHMQNRLTGLAKKWYENLKTYDYTWVEWKRILVKSFPEHHDFATVLRKLVQRTKSSNESWEHYYFEKMELINACEIKGKKAVSCLIDGIPDATLQAGARAGRYESPSLLYAEYLSTLTSGISTIEKVSHRDTANVQKNLTDSSPKKMEFGNEKRASRCYNCKETGHFSNKCPKPRLECKKCRRLGHSEKECRRFPFTVKTHLISQQAKVVKDSDLNGVAPTGATP